MPQELSVGAADNATHQRAFRMRAPIARQCISVGFRRDRRTAVFLFSYVAGAFRARSGVCAPVGTTATREAVDTVS